MTGIWWPRVRTVATLVARLLLGLVFAFSALSKITAPAAFRDSVAAYHLLPAALVTPFALALPWIEALVALYLLVGLFLRPTAIVTTALLVMFTGALTISLIRGGSYTSHGCGCFSSSGPLASLPFVSWLAGGATITPFDVVRDLVFIGLAAVVYWGDRFALSVEGLLARPAPAVDEDEGNDVEDDEQDDVTVTVPATRLVTRSAVNGRRAPVGRGQRR